MPSVVDVCNLALDRVGHEAITSLSDGNKAANLCTRLWPIARDSMLREHPWNFAVSRAITAPSASSPDFGFTYQHPLPSDSLRLLEVDGMTSLEYQLEGDSILTDDDTLYIRYIASITDPNKYDTIFVDLVSAYLAFLLVEPLTQSNTKKSALWNEYQQILSRAKKADAMENPTVALQEDDWITARL